MPKAQPKASPQTKPTKSVKKPVAKPAAKVVTKSAKAVIAKPTAKTPAKKAEKSLLQKYRLGKDDTGSTPVQIVIFTDKIGKLSAHLKKNAKDFDSKRGLLMMVGRRRRLLNYLRERNDKIYAKLVADLGLRG